MKKTPEESKLWYTWVEQNAVAKLSKPDILCGIIMLSKLNIVVPFAVGSSATFAWWYFIS